MPYSIAPSLALNKDVYIKTWQLFIIILLANLLAGWFYNEHILTRDVYQNLLSEQLEAERIDEYFNFMRKLTLWGYIFQPILTWIHVTFHTLLIQMPLILMMIDIPFRRLFRIVMCASLSMTVSAIVKIIWLINLPASEISLASLSVAPLSIASFLDTTQYPSTAFMVLNKFSLFEAAWCLVIYKGLVDTEKLKKDLAAFLVFCMWMLLLLLQWGITAYLNGVSG